MQTDWEIQPRSSVCSECKTAFADKSPYYTLLSFSASGYTRRDLCGMCWTVLGGKATEGVVSFWQGTFRAPAPPPPEPIGKQTAETKLRALASSDDPSHAGVRYILAVMLERKKILRHRDTVKQDGRDVLVYEHTGTGETFVIVDPHLRLDQLEEVQRQVVAQLSADRGVTSGA